MEVVAGLLWAAVMPGVAWGQPSPSSCSSPGQICQQIEICPRAVLRDAPTLLLSQSLPAKEGVRGLVSAPGFSPFPFLLMPRFK